MYSVIKHKVRSLLGLNTLNEYVQDIYWANLFQQTIADSAWLKNRNFSWGRWAVGPSMLYVLYRIYNEFKPVNIVEFGLGQSTKMSIQYVEFMKNKAQLTVFEHDQEWIDFFRRGCTVPENICLYRTDLNDIVYQGFRTTSYSGLSSMVDKNHYDLIIVDGPFGSERYSRFNLIEIIEKKAISTSFIIVMHDTNRQGEKDTRNLSVSLLGEKNVCLGYYGKSEECTVIASRDNRFFCSL